MSTGRFIYLTGFIIFVVVLVALAMSDQAIGATVGGGVAPLAVHRPVAPPAAPQPTPAATPNPLNALATEPPIAPAPAPTPPAEQPIAATSQTTHFELWLVPLILMILSGLGGLGARGKLQPTTTWRTLRPLLLIGPSIVVLLSLLLFGCNPPAANTLPPDEYLDQALNWLEANAVSTASVDWDEVRAEAATIVGQPQTTAETYPAIEYAIEQLNDPEAFMITPDRDGWQGAGLGITAVYPQNFVVEVEAGSPAAAAGIQVYDQVLAVDGQAPAPRSAHPWQVDFPLDGAGAQPVAITLQRGSDQFQVTVTPALYDFASRVTSRALPAGAHEVAYLDLPFDPGTQLFPTAAQAAMSSVDGPDTCGWIIDLRRTRGGNLWSYFAALSPILGEGELGGFLYNDGSEESWRLLDGKVYWADEERDESYVRGPRHELERPSPPVALLTGPLTEAAGELVIVAFQGWGNVRTFGEPTLGAPNLILNTPLSDGAHLFVSGAQGMDRNGRLYAGPIPPDESVSIQWQELGNDNEPVIAAALAWLISQPACTS